MPRISGVNINENKRLVAGLSLLYGIGPTLASEIEAKLKLKGNPKFSDLTETQIDQLRDLIEKHYLVESDLRQTVNQNIRRLKEIGAYRGVRHSRNLPVHGQRTRTNARTKRGKKITVGSGRKKASEKT